MTPCTRQYTRQAGQWLVGGAGISPAHHITHHFSPSQPILEIISADPFTGFPSHVYYSLLLPPLICRSVLLYRNSLHHRTPYALVLHSYGLKIWNRWMGSPREHCAQDLGAYSVWTLRFLRSGHTIQVIISVGKKDFRMWAQIIWDSLSTYKISSPRVKVQFLRESSGQGKTSPGFLSLEARFLTFSESRHMILGLPRHKLRISGIPVVWAKYFGVHRSVTF